jgi:hypothetical protein
MAKARCPEPGNHPLRQWVAVQIHARLFVLWRRFSVARVRLKLAAKRGGFGCDHFIRRHAHTGAEQAQTQNKRQGRFQFGQRHGFEGSLHEDRYSAGDDPRGQRFAGGEMQGGRGRGPGEAGWDGRGPGFRAECRRRPGRREQDAPTSQAGLQHLPRACQTAGDGSFFPTQFPGRFRLGLAFQAAQHQGHAIFRGQMIDLLVQQRLQFLERLGRRKRPRRRGGLTALMGLASGRFSSCVHGHPIGDAMEPVSQPLSPAQGSRLQSQDEEAGLKSILGILFVVQDMPADVPHQPAMTAHESGKSRFLTPAHKLFE